MIKTQISVQLVLPYKKICWERKEPVEKKSWMMKLRMKYLEDTFFKSAIFKIKIAKYKR